MHGSESSALVTRTTARCLFGLRRSAGYGRRLDYAKAFAEDWILITNDKDFGEKVYRQGYRHHGVVFLRLSDERPTNKIDVLGRLLQHYPDKLLDRFVVVTETRVRFARK